MPEKIKAATIHRLLGEEPSDRIRQYGLTPFAVRGMIRHPTDNALLPAVVCRLYPETDLARLKFAQARVMLSQAVVFPDPGDDLELTLLEGFHNALLHARRALDSNDYGPTRAGAGPLPDDQEGGAA